MRASLPQPELIYAVVTIVRDEKVARAIGGDARKDDLDLPVASPETAPGRYELAVRIEFLDAAEAASDIRDVDVAGAVYGDAAWQRELTVPRAFAPPFAEESPAA